MGQPKKVRASGSQSIRPLPLSPSMVLLTRRGRPGEYGSGDCLQLTLSPTVTLQKNLGVRGARGCGPRAEREI